VFILPHEAKAVIILPFITYQTRLVEVVI